ncbi:hypothetical protein DPMN_101903 [Dreissena polymorpha]|uniref:Uncharacterized protein n=1 Tax=Dreissena polymorpha TaxID=45954 RepID=A0A9D4RA35_DREPO|nr:hypothetical protein DPMN_101903 [Dreissena polymorpha]
MNTWSTSEKSAAILVMGVGTDPSILSHTTTHAYLVDIREECSHSGHGGGYRSLSPLTQHNTTHAYLVHIREECSHSGHGGRYRSLSPLTH